MRHTFYKCEVFPLYGVAKYNGWKEHLDKVSTSELRGVSDACAVCKNIAYYRMRMGIIGDQFAHSVADDLNI